MSKRRSAGAELLKKSRGLNLLAENIKNNFVRKPVRLVNISTSLNSSQSDASFAVSQKPHSKLALRTPASYAVSPFRPKASPARTKPRNQPASASSSLSPSSVQVPKHRNHMSPVVVLNVVPEKSPLKQPAPSARSKNDLIVKGFNEPNSSNYQNPSVNKRAPGDEDDKPAWSAFKKPAPKSVAMRRNNPATASSKNAVSSSSDRGYSSEAKIPIRKRKEEDVQIVEENTLSSSESLASCSPTKIIKYDDLSMEMTANSSFSPGLHDSVSYCLTRRKNQLNMSLHQSFLSLGTLNFDTSFATLPEWIAEAHQKRSQQPSQILAKVEYKSPIVKKMIPLRKNPAAEDDNKLMPPPRGSPRRQAKEKYDPQIRIQNGKENLPEIKNWCFKFIKNGKIALQGYDITGKRGITSSEIVSVKNLRTIKTAKSTYQLVGAIDRSRLEKENVFNSIASHFSNGFPTDWKELISRHSKEATGEDTVQEDDSDADLRARSVKVVVKQPADSDSQAQPEKQDLKEKISEKFRAATKTRQDKREASKNTKAIGSKPEKISDAEYSIDARIYKGCIEISHIIPGDAIVSTPEEPGLNLCPSESEKIGLLNVCLRKWSLQVVEDMRNKWSFCISGQVDGGKMMSFNLEEWTVERPRLLRSSCCAQGFQQIELFGSPLFKSGDLPDFVVEAFEDGFQPNYLKTFENWQSSLTAASVRRSSRAAAPLKHWEGDTFMRRGDFAKFERLPKTKTSVLAKPKTTLRRRPNKRVETASDMMSSDDDFTATIKPNTNTVKAQKKKAEYKAKHKDKATYRNQDFFGNPDTLITSYDEFNAILSPAAKLRAAAGNCLSPMANFVNSQSEHSSSDTDDDREEEEVRDKRKKKTFEKFVFHESNKPKKKLQTRAKNPVVPTKSKYKKSEVINLKNFLDKNLDRKKEYERRMRLGEDSDNSDFD